MPIVATRDRLLELVSNHFLSSRSQDRQQHGLGLIQDIIIADPKHLESLLASQESASSGIFLGPLIMTSSIDLHYEADLVTKEIHDVGTDRLLPAKFQSGEARSTQAVPEHPFGNCRIAAQAPCVFGGRQYWAPG
jgi:hypothetical protein